MLSADEIIDLKKKSTHPISFSAKDFEPNGSVEETNQIQNSLAEIEKIISNEKIKKLGSLSQADWLPDLQLAEVTLQSGSHWFRFGHRKNRKLYLNPEEALYLLETGSLELNYNEVPLSVQRAYSILLALSNGFSLEKYRVYSHLNAIGYKVTRHSVQNSMQTCQEELKEHKLCGEDGKRKSNVDLSEKNFKSSKKLKLDETKTSELTDLKSNLQIITKKSEFSHPLKDCSESIFDFDLYLPSKKQTLKPDFRIFVHRGSDPMPDLNKVANISKKYKDNVPVINAIVLPDYVTFYMINPINIPNAVDPST